MDVQCPQCAFAYELDDALITSTGTLVRCTQCEHKFRVTHDSDCEDEPWIVKTFDGDTARFRNRTDVEQAIVRGELGRSDLLARGRGEARPLGNIVELDAYFDQQQRVGSLEVVSRPGSVPDDTLTSPNLLSRTSAVVLESSPDVASARASRPTHSAPLTPFPRAPSSFPPAREARRMPGLVDSAYPASARVSDRAPSSENYALISAPSSRSYASEASRLAVPIDVRPRARKTGWVVAISLLLGVGSSAFLLGRRYTKAQQAPVASTVAADFSGVAADILAGRLERSRVAIDALSKTLGADPQLLAVRTFLAISQADVAESLAIYEKMAGLPGAAPLAIAAEEAAAHAIKASERWAEVAPDAPESIFALAQSFALMGQRARAQQYIDRIGPAAPSYAYSAALLASLGGSPDAANLLEKAYQSEPFRARLRFLSRGLAKENTSVQNALIAELRATCDSANVLRWLDGFRAAVEADAAAPVPKKIVAADDFGVAFEGESEPSTGGGSAGGTATKSGKKLPSDPRRALEEGDRARRRGDHEEARALFQVALEANPLDSEALAGLGDCARDAHDLAAALAYYRKALNANPSFLPARIGLADAQWAGGDRTSASRGYREIMENFPEGAYPALVKERALGQSTTPEQP